MRALRRYAGCRPTPSSERRIATSAAFKGLLLSNPLVD